MSQLNGKTLQVLKISLVVFPTQCCFFKRHEVSHFLLFIDIEEETQETENLDQDQGDSDLEDPIDLIIVSDVVVRRPGLGIRAGLGIHACGFHNLHAERFHASLKIINQ